MKRSSSRTEDDTQELSGRDSEAGPAPRRREFRKFRKNDARRESLRRPEVLLLLAALVSLVLVLPLRGLLSPVPALLFLATLVLFLVPGFLVSYLVADESFSGAGRLPVAFVFGTGIFGLLSLPFLVLHRSFDEYLWASGAVLVVSLVLLARIGLRGSDWTPGAVAQRSLSLAGLLWVPLAAFAAALAYAASRVVPEPNEDHWAYLAYVQEYMDAEQLARLDPLYGTELVGFSRLTLNGWISIQAAFSRVSGMEPVDLASAYLSPALVVVSLLAFYWLARVLFESRGAGLLTGSLYGLFLLFYMNTSPTSFGGNLVRRVLEDKFAAQYIMLPVAIGLAVLYLKKRGWLRLGAFAFVFWTTGVVHPMVMGILGLGVAALGAVHLLSNRRDRRAWGGVLALGAVVFLTLVPPAAYLLITDSPLLSKLNTLDPALVENRLNVWEDQERLLVLGEGSYIMHPSLVLNPVIGAAYLIGVPFLIWRAGRSLAAQALLGILLFFAALVYFPPLASLAGEYVRPWLIYRLAWPIPPAALLTVGWMVWELLRYARRRFEGTRLTVATPLLALALVLLLTAVAAPRALAGIRTIDAVDETPQYEASCTDPAFDRLREVVETSSVVLAPALENSCIPAYSPFTNVVSYRDQFLEENVSDEAASAASLKVQAVQDFFAASTVDSAMIETLQTYEVGYVLLPTGSPLNVQLGHLPGFTALDTPGARYRLYGVDRNNLFVTQTVAANDALQNGDPYAAIDAYNVALTGDPNEMTLAYTGLGLAYDSVDSPSEAATFYEEAVDLAPQEPSLYSLLSEAYGSTGEDGYEAQALQSGIERIASDVGLRTELSSVLQSQDAAAAAAIQRTVVERFPDVPPYRIDLGKLLAISGEEASAERQFGEAISQNPLSAELRASVALALQLANQNREALRYYEQALDLEPDSPQYNLNVGKIYAGLSTKDGRNERYFRRAERHLERAAELEPRPYRLDVRASAWDDLGDLYASWEREGQAIEAYERALEINPGLTQTQQQLEELRQTQ